MKINKAATGIFGIVFVAFTAVMFLISEERGLGFWCFYVGLVLGGLNIVLICWYIQARSEWKNAIMDYSLFLPPIVSMVVVVRMAWKMHNMVEYASSYYLAIHIVVFAVSFAVQVALWKARSSNVKQEQKIAEKRFWRDEQAYSWKVIAEKCDASIQKEACAVADSFRYSDAMSNDQLAELENRIEKVTQEVNCLLQSGNVEEQLVLQKINETRELLRERNDKCRRMK